MFFLFAIITVGFIYIVHVQNTQNTEDSGSVSYVDRKPSIEEEELLLLDSSACTCDYQQQLQNQLWLQEQDRLFQEQDRIYQEQVFRDESYNDHWFQEQMMMDTFNDPFMNDPFF